MLNDGYLITEWAYEYKRYRLVRTGNRHVDRYIVERDDKDTLGGPHWVPVQEWTDTINGRMAAEAPHALIALVQKLLSERDQARALVENTAQRERMEAGHA